MTVPLCAQPAEQGFREDFETLANWKPLTFPKIPRHSAYSILKEDGKSILVAVADNSASGTDLYKVLQYLSNADHQMEVEGVQYLSGRR